MFLLVQIPRRMGSPRLRLPAAAPRASGSKSTLSPSERRADVCVDLQRIPAVCAARQPPLHLARDGEPVRRQGGALRRGKLHLRGEQHRYQGEGPQLADAAAPQE